MNLDDLAAYLCESVLTCPPHKRTPPSRCKFVDASHDRKGVVANQFLDQADAVGQAVLPVHRPKAGFLACASRPSPCAQRHPAPSVR